MFRFQFYSCLPLKTHPTRENSSQWRKVKAMANTDLTCHTWYSFWIWTHMDSFTSNCHATWLTNATAEIRNPSQLTRGKSKIHWVISQLNGSFPVLLMMSVNLLDRRLLKEGTITWRGLQNRAILRQYFFVWWPDGTI